MILFRGGPKTSDYLTRFFSLLDISGSLSSGGGPLIQGNYWMDDGSSQDPSQGPPRRRWPYYDDGNVMTNLFHELMVFMAKLSRLSALSMSDLGLQQPEEIAVQAAEIHDELLAWWQQCPPALRDQSNDWRTQARPRKLTVPETLEEEAFSSTKSCKDGCIIYMNHILDPLGAQPQKQEVIEAVADILEIAKEMPRGYGLEMGLYWGLFMAGIAIFNDPVAEDLIRSKLKADTNSNIYVWASPFYNICIILTICSMLTELLICSKFFGNDSTNIAGSLTGDRFRFKWAFTCKLLKSSEERHLIMNADSS